MAHPDGKQPGPPRRPRPGGWLVRAGLAGLLLLGALLPAHGYPDEYPAGSRIDWQPFAPELFERARTHNHKIFMYFHGQWCSWCRDFQDDSLEHAKVVAALEAGHIPVLVDLDRRRDLFTRYGGRGLPFVVILDARDEVQGRFTGHVAPDDLARILTEGRHQVSVTGRELAPSDAAIDGVAGFLRMLDEVYDPASRRLDGSAMFGTLSKRPQPWTLAFLLRQEAWRERMPGLLDQVVEDLADPEEGGFFFFHDPDQAAAGRALETSKRLDLNAAFLWLFADAYAHLEKERYRTVVERTLHYLETHLWEPAEQRFFTSQHSDRYYYGQSLAGRADLAPPPVDRTSYADASAQAIAALVRAAQALEDPDLLKWAGAALEGLDRHLRADQGYYHALPPGGPPELAGYLPSQVWPAIAWQLHQAASGQPSGERLQDLLEHIAGFHDPVLNAYRERRTQGLEPWVETRTQAALAWLLAALPHEDVEAAGMDREVVWTRLVIPPGADPDDVALGFKSRHLAGALLY